MPGKEYSNDVDKDASGSLDPGQIVHWEGNGTSIWDSFDYCLEGGTNGGISFQVDALANIRDKLFLDLDGTRDAVYKDNDQTPYHDTVSLLVSFQDSEVQAEYEKNIYASRSAYRGGSAELWAQWNTNINATSGALDDVDGLEIYGPNQTDDANMYSRAGDPIPDGETERFSVFRLKPNTLNPGEETYGVSTPYLATQVLLDAVIDDDENHPDWDVDHNPGDFDVDAMMIWDVLNDDEFGEGDMILFSVRPIEDLFDGGEIWLYKSGDDSAEFLTHGLLDDDVTPRVWNTANEVSLHFFGDESHSENINALEAVVPEPSTLALTIVGGLLMLHHLPRRRRVA
ncbi:MAG: PEP-CTERM sorting domain-containing protein [Pirellulales bacterium]|nr:PEP-CTERM sorting domain-containing protein [Pirellulales bacterium]